MPRMSCAIRGGRCDCYALRLAWTLPIPCCHGRQACARQMECGQAIGMPKWNARPDFHRIASEKPRCRKVCTRYTRAAAKFIERADSGFVAMDKLTVDVNDQIAVVLVELLEHFLT